MLLSKTKISFKLLLGIWNLEITDDAEKLLVNNKKHTNINLGIIFSEFLTNPNFIEKYKQIDITAIISISQFNDYLSLLFNNIKSLMDINFIIKLYPSFIQLKDDYYNIFKKFFDEKFTKIISEENQENINNTFLLEIMLYYFGNVSNLKKQIVFLKIIQQYINFFSLKELFMTFIHHQGKNYSNLSREMIKN